MPKSGMCVPLMAASASALHRAQLDSRGEHRTNPSASPTANPASIRANQNIPTAYMVENGQGKHFHHLLSMVSKMITRVSRKSLMLYTTAFQGLTMNSLTEHSVLRAYVRTLEPLTNGNDNGYREDLVPDVRITEDWDRIEVVNAECQKADSLKHSLRGALFEMDPMLRFNQENLVIPLSPVSLSYHTMFHSIPYSIPYHIPYRTIFHD